MSSRSSSNLPSFEFSGLHRVGWIKSAHGIRGEIFLRLNADRADWADGAEKLYLLSQADQTPVAFTLVSMSPHKDGWIVRLEGVNDRNRAENLAKSTVYIEKSLLVSEPGESIYLDQIMAFAVVDKGGRKLGDIVGFASNGPQDLLRVRPANGGAEALVPLVEAFLVFIDFDKKQITMDLPPGLIDLEEE